MRKQQIITGVVLAAVLLGQTGCGRVAANPAGADVPAAPIVEPAPGYPGGDPGLYQPGPGQNYPGDYNGDGSTDMPSLPDPGSFPEPPPAIQTPAQPGQTRFEAKAVANTTHFNLPIAPYVRGTFVHMNVTWQPVPGAKEFWIYKGAAPTKEQANRETAYAVRPAGVLGGGSFTDGTTPPNMVAGGFLDKIKRLGQMVTIRPGVKQSYKVIAVDETGTPFAESQIVESTPMLPIAPPMLLEPSDTQGTKPLFTWDDMKMEGQHEIDPVNQPDGYYVAVFPSFAGAQGLAMPNAVAAWATYRDKRVKMARYGQDNISNQPYPGTLPFTATVPLQMNQSYAWTVISTKTDTGNMLTAKAVSKSWGMVQNFQVGTAPATGSAGSSTSSSSSSNGSGVTINGAKQVASQATSIWSKIKNIFS